MNWIIRRAYNALSISDRLMLGCYKGTPLVSCLPLRLRLYAKALWIVGRGQKRNAD